MTPLARAGMEGIERLRAEARAERLAAPPPAPTLCECTLMACASGEATAYMLATNHHPSCSKGWPPEALRLIARLASGMEAWARDEDGVHPDAWSAYEDARAVVSRANGNGGAS